MASPESEIIFGVFKGMGDLVCAAPVILAELRRNRSVHLLLFPNATLHEFSSLIDFSPYQGDLHVHLIPDRRAVKWKQFTLKMRSIKPEIIWISPHAPAADSSWKIPLMLKAFQLFFWRRAHLVGAKTERLSVLFHHRISVNRLLPLQQREWNMYCLFRGASLSEQPPKINFLRKIMDRRRVRPLYDLVIHPGANAKNRLWPLHKYGPLVDVLPQWWRIAILGLPDDLEFLKITMPENRTVEYITGSICDALMTLASASMLLIMDSGNVHFAQVLGVPSVAVFGYTEPADIIDLTGCVDALYEQRFSCQPCRKAICSQPEIYCLNSLDSSVVAEKLKIRWESQQCVRGSLTNLINPSKD